MTEDYQVQQRPSALPYLVVGGGAGAVGSTLLTSKNAKVREWTHEKPAYSSYEDLVKEAADNDKFTKAAKDAGVAEENVSKLQAEIKNAEELYNKKSEIVTEYFKEGAVKENDVLKTARKEYLEAVEEQFNAQKAKEALAADATADAKSAADKAIKEAEDKLAEKLKNVTDEAAKITEKITKDDAKTGDALKTEVENILGKKSDATKNFAEKSSLKDEFAKLTKGAKNWKTWAAIGGATVLTAALALLFRPKAKEE